MSIIEGFDPRGFIVEGKGIPGQCRVQCGHRFLHSSAGDDIQLQGLRPGRDSENVLHLLMPEQDIRIIAFVIVVIHERGRIDGDDPTEEHLVGNDLSTPICIAGGSGPSYKSFVQKNIPRLGTGRDNGDRIQFLDLAHEELIAGRPSGQANVLLGIASRGVGIPAI